MVGLYFLVILVSATAKPPPIDTTGSPTLYGGITQTQCSSYYIAIVLKTICGTYNTILEDLTCDKHCQCAHGAVWGGCAHKFGGSPSPVYVGENQQYCACYYNATAKPPPPSHVPHAIDSADCKAFVVISDVICGTESLYTMTGLLTPIPTCTADCICAHSMNTGVCKTTTIRRGLLDLPVAYNECICQ